MIYSPFTPSQSFIVYVMTVIYSTFMVSILFYIIIIAVTWHYWFSTWTELSCWLGVIDWVLHPSDRTFCTILIRDRGDKGNLFTIEANQFMHFLVCWTGFKVMVKNNARIRFHKPFPGCRITNHMLRLYVVSMQDDSILVKWDLCIHLITHIRITSL